MTTDAQEQRDLIAALQLESAFTSRHLSRHFVGFTDERNRKCADPAVHFSNDPDAVRLRARLAFVDALAVKARGLSTGASRAAANVATWRSYLPEECVAAMIKDGWHRST